MGNTVARVAQVITIAQSGQVSGDIDLGGARAIGILAPTLTSCQLFLQGNTDTVSGNCMRAFDADGAAEWSWEVAAGSRAIVVQDVLWPFAQARIEASVAQANVRSFTVITRR